MKYLLIYNPVSGKGKFSKKIPMIEKYFEEKNLELDIYESKSAIDLKEKSEYYASLYDCIIASGGDGTINDVVNGIMKVSKKPILAVIPGGTANDIAAILGINKKIRRTLDIITTSSPVKMDLNLLNDRYFVYTTAAGILTKISYDIPRTKIKKFGYFAYLVEGIKDLRRKYQMNMEIEYDNGKIEGTYMLALGLTSRRVGGMFLNKFSESKINDGRMELRLIKAKKHFKLFKLAKFYLFGGKKSKNDVHLISSYFKINTDSSVTWNTDGEKASNGVVHIKVIKEAISVFASEKAIKKFF